MEVRMIIFTFLLTAGAVFMLVLTEMFYSPRFAPTHRKDPVQSVVAAGIIGLAWPLFVPMRIYYTWKNYKNGRR